VSFWTEARVTRLTDLWERGYSAGAIAQLMDTTRSAIAGKAWRLELPEREVVYRLPPYRRKPRRRPLSPHVKVNRRTPRPRHNSDFSWHLAQVAAGVAPRGNVPDPPEGFPSWRTFNRRVAADPVFAAQLLVAKEKYTLPAAA
jgi:hypothetical protein